ncbi:MAG: T9SS type A sorting domain-containing protein [Bacteroidales bacterium]|nr:T9SS type A sorting domain-containing protein [Bacteroidales bacterium]
MKQILLIVTIILIVILSQAEFCFSQRWEIIHGVPTRKDVLYDIVEQYDLGYSIGAKIDTVILWNIKTDINGNSLWDKTIQHNSAISFITSMTRNSSGEIVIAGSIYLSELGGWPSIIKIDSCGEKVWCRYFYTDQFIHGVFLDIMILNNGDILALARFESYEQNEQVFLICFDENGNMLWEQSYATKYDYPEIAFAIGWDLYQFQDHFLISGYCYWPYPGTPNVVWMRPLFIYIDSDFNEQWILPYGVSDSIVGKVLGTIQLSDSEFMGYGKCYPDEKSGILTNALLARFNSLGQETEYVIIPSDEINPPTNFNLIHNAVPINDTLFMASANFGPAYQENPNGEYIFDLNGNIYQYQSRPNTWGTSKVIKTSDNKFVFGTSIFEDEKLLKSDILLYKLNAYLEQDTLYTGNYTYDSLCPHQIQSGVIDISDCGIVVNIDEIPSPKAYYASLKTIPVKAFPNPAREQITLQYENTGYHTNIRLQCFDILGRKVHVEKIYPYQGASNVDVSKWNVGMYVAIVTSEGKVVGKCKFIVK